MHSSVLPGNAEEELMPVVVNAQDQRQTQFLEEDSVVEAVADLKQKFFDNSKAYGYTPTEIQLRAIAHFSAGENVILRVVSGDTPLEDSQVVHHTSKGNTKTLQASGGEIPDASLGGGGYMPGKIATYSLGILNRLDLSGPVKLQCLIFIFDHLYMYEVVEEMKTLGGGRVQVSRLTHQFTENESSPHVAVGASRYLLGLLLDQPSRFRDVKMLVFDWGYTSCCTEHVKTTQRIYMIMRQRFPSNELQFAIFAETEVPSDFKMRQKPNQRIEILDYPACRKYTLQGIKKHMFVNVQVDDEDVEDSVKLREPKVKAIVDFIEKLESGKRNRIVIVATLKAEFDHLTKELRGLCELTKLSKGMTQKERDSAAENFIRGKSVLITRRVWFRDMHPKFFALKVRRIIYYDLLEEDYMQTMGWFHHVGGVITIVDHSELRELLLIQKARSVKFHRTEPRKIVGAKLEGRKLYGKMAGSDKYKTVNMRILDHIVIATGHSSTTSIVFVKESRLVDGLVTELKDLFEKS